MADARGKPSETVHSSTESVFGQDTLDWPRANTRLLAALALGVGLDVATSAVGVPMPGIVETNPVVAAGFRLIGWPAFPLYYLVLGTFLVLVVRVASIPSRWLTRIGWVAVVFLAATVCNNVFVLATHA